MLLCCGAARAGCRAGLTHHRVHLPAPVRSLGALPGLHQQLADHFKQAKSPEVDLAPMSSDKAGALAAWSSLLGPRPVLLTVSAACTKLCVARPGPAQPCSVCAKGSTTQRRQELQQGQALASAADGHHASSPGRPSAVPRHQDAHLPGLPQTACASCP